MTAHDSELTSATARELAEAVDYTRKLSEAIGRFCANTRAFNTAEAKVSLFRKQYPRYRDGRTKEGQLYRLLCEAKGDIWLSMQDAEDKLLNLILNSNGIQSRRGLPMLFQSDDE